MKGKIRDKEEMLFVNAVLPSMSMIDRLSCIRRRGSKTLLVVPNRKVYRVISRALTRPLLDELDESTAGSQKPR